MSKAETYKIIESIGYWALEISKVCDQELEGMEKKQHLLDGHRVLDRYRALQSGIDKLKENPIQSFMPKEEPEDEFEINIVDIIKSKIDITKSGVGYVALCPFHKEETPSFTINPQKQFYHCFSCGAHGDGVDFMNAFEAGEFREQKEKEVEIDDVKESLKKVLDFLNTNAQS